VVSRSLVAAVIAFGPSACVAAPQTSGGGSASGQPPTGTFTCPPTIDRDGPLGFNSATGRSLVDPSTTHVLVCRYVSTVANREQAWQPDANGVVAGERATALVKQVNAAPAANLLMRCPSSTREELWFFATGATVTAELWVQLDGCSFASDGTHTVSWGYGDPLLS